MKYPFFLAVILTLLIMPIAAPFDPMRTDTDHALHAPDAVYVLGTDHLGRDVLSRVLYGGQRTVFVTVSATLCALSIGVLLGLAMGSWPVFSALLLPLVTACLALPSLLLALVLLTLWGRGLFPLIAALVVPQIPVVTRVVQSAVRPLYTADYVLASVSSGANSLYVLRQHIWSNLAPFVRQYSGILFSQMLFQSGALSLLDLGGEPGIPDWGAMMADGRTAFLLAPWTVLVPGLLMMLLVMLANWVLGSE